jgi:hypothetical protein
MADERYASGNTLASFFRSGVDVLEDVTPGRFDGRFVTNSIAVAAGPGPYFSTFPFIDRAAPLELWLHFEYYVAVFNGSGAYVPVVFRNAAGVPVARLALVGSAWVFSYWNGVGFVVTGAPIAADAGVLTRMDVHLICGTSGSFALYSNGSRIALGPIASASTDAVAAVQFGAMSSLDAGSQTTFYSQVMVANFDTRDARYVCQLANANGFYTDGTGSYVDINEIVLDETTAITLPLAGQRKSFTHGVYSLPPGYLVDALAIAGRVRNVGPSPADVQFLLRAGGAPFDSPSLAASATYEPRGAFFPLDPATGAAWNQSDLNNAEFGIATV